MVHWEIIFFAVALAASAAGKFLSPDPMTLLASKIVFVLAFVLFAAALLARLTEQRRRGKGRRRLSSAT